MTAPDLPLLDLSRLHATIREELDAAIAGVVDTSAFTGASPRFEEAFARAHGARFAVGCASGTDAVMLALVAAGVGPGDEVVVPSMTFVATAEAVVHAGARPVLADVGPGDLLLDVGSLQDVVTDRTRAVVPVHLYGNMVDPDCLRWCRQRGLVVVEDAAQAHLAERGGVRVGERADAACFSFYPGKNLGALGDGGAVVTDDEGLAERLRVLRDHGSPAKYHHDVVGWCSRLDGLQSAVLEVKLRHLPAWTAARRRLAERYRAGLGDLVVPWAPGAVHHLLVVRVADRPSVVERLAAAGIGTGIHYPRALSQQPALSAWHRPTPVAEAAADEVLSLPLDPLMADADVDRVVAAVLAATGR